jgi:hypothetical protein
VHRREAWGICSPARRHTPFDKFQRKIPAEQKSASRNSLAGNRLQKCKHPRGKVPFFHELKSSQKTLPAWVHFHALSFPYLQKKLKQKLKRLQLVVSRLPRNTTIHRKLPLFSLTKRKRNAL